MYNRHQQQQGSQPYKRPEQPSNSPWLFGHFGYTADVNCNNFVNPYYLYQSGLFPGGPHQFPPTVNNYNALIPTGSNANSMNTIMMNNERSMSRNRSQQNNINNLSNRRNVGPGRTSNRRRQKGNKDKVPESYGNISDFCMKLSKQQLEGTFWIDIITRHVTSIDKQISLFLLCIEADEKFYEKADNMCEKLKRIFQPEFPGYEFSLKLFGSSRTRLALKDSDFDVYVDFGDGQKPGNLQNRITKVVKKYKNSLLFQVITPIKARVPIVQCKSFIEPCCDISFKKPLGVCNSSLIRFLISLDERIRPVILIIKFWLKMNSLLHFSKVSSYGLANLAVFYFQQIPNPILPSVHFLQEKSPSEEIIDGWNVSFTEDKTVWTSTKNNMSIFELVKGFLNFYRDFDFESYAICTYLGRAIPKSRFISADKLPSELKLYKNHLNTPNAVNGFMDKNPVWLQDPLVHNYNVSRNSISVRDFKRKVFEASAIVNKQWEKSRSGDYKCVLFKELFRRVEKKQNYVVPQKNKKGKKGKNE